MGIHQIRHLTNHFCATCIRTITERNFFCSKFVTYDGTNFRMKAVPGRLLFVSGISTDTADTADGV